MVLVSVNVREKKEERKKRKEKSVHLVTKTTLSCAYDSILTILHHIFVDNRQGWDNSEQCSLEDMRNRIRLPLSQGDPESFPI